MCEVGFPGCEKALILDDTRELEALIKFILQASVLMGLKRAGQSSKVCTAI